MPLVSVVIPIFNGARYLKGTLDSLFAQTFLNFEVICIDDGSTDESLRVLEAYEAKLRVIRQKNAGQSASRNRGAAMAAGTYIAFLDQDDLWYPEKLDRQMARFGTSPEAVLVHCDYDVINQSGELVRRAVGRSDRATALSSPLGLLIGEALIFPSAMVIRKDAYLRAGGFCEALRGFEDFDLIARLKQQGRFSMVESPEMAYRVHAEGFSRAGGMGVIQSREAFLLRMRQLSSGDEEKERLIRHMLADCYSDWGKEEVNAGNPHDGRRRLLQSISCNPVKFRTYQRLFKALLHTALLR